MLVSAPPSRILRSESLLSSVFVDPDLHASRVLSGEFQMQVEEDEEEEEEEGEGEVQA